VSIGDYVLSGSHVAALTVLDSNPQNRMSALPLKADVGRTHQEVRFVPIADIGWQEQGPRFDAKPQPVWGRGRARQMSLQFQQQG